MNIQEEHLQAIQLIAENERTLQQLYKAYSEKFPEYAWLWDKLAEEEAKHARWVDTLLKKIHEGMASFGNRQFKTPVIQSSIRYLREEIERANTQNISLAKALSTTVYVERSLLENKFLEVFDGDPLILKHVLTNLSKHSQIHQQLVEQAWEQYQRTHGTSRTS